MCREFVCVCVIFFVGVISHFLLSPVSVVFPCSLRLVFFSLFCSCLTFLPSTTDFAATWPLSASRVCGFVCVTLDDMAVSGLSFRFSFCVLQSLTKGSLCLL